jgi:hypothetical protein
LKLESAEQPQYKQVLRVVTIWDEDKQEELAFLTNRFDFGTTHHRRDLQATVAD